MITGPIDNSPHAQEFTLFQIEAAKKFHEMLADNNKWKYALTRHRYDDDDDEDEDFNWLETDIAGFTMWVERESIKCWFIFEKIQKVINVSFNGIPFIRENIEGSKIYQRILEIKEHIKTERKLEIINKAKEKLAKI